MSKMKAPVMSRGLFLLWQERAGRFDGIYGQAKLGT